ncbi:Uncharacterized protein Adt_11619 [Abeliophyllum distichum]|uniref:Uncharacterized protein n=1 Tax=Abeliophyllum distichum TaxID=126358 RepID=A0ABD1UPT3_9LAMI
MAKRKNRGQTMLESIRNASTSQHDNEAERIPQTHEALMAATGKYADNVSGGSKSERIQPEEFNETLADVPFDEQELEEVRYRIFESVIGSKGHGHGHVRTMGLGPTPSQLKSKQDAHSEMEAHYEEKLKTMEEDHNNQRNENEQRMKTYDDQLASLRSEIELM